MSVLLMYRLQKIVELQIEGRS